jgi:hypothetical protein
MMFLAAGFPLFLLGCGPDCAKMCEERKDCEGASQDVDCEKSCEDAEKTAEAAGCESQYEDALSCQDDQDDQCSLTGCEAKLTALQACVLE